MGNSNMNSKEAFKLRKFEIIPRSLYGPLLEILSSCFHAYFVVTGFFSPKGLIL